MQKSNFHPKVSIVIPVYNGSNYLEEAIDSALSQTYDNVEVIVVNDGSNDNGKTDKICKSYGDKIRYFVKENGGVATALNKGIEEMRGEYFSWLSHDDIYYPNKVEEQVKCLNELTNKNTIIYSGIEIIDASGRHIESINYSKKYREEDLNKSLFPFLHLALNGCAMLISKHLFSKVGVFDQDRPTVQDYDLWFRLLRNNEIKHVGKILVKSRSHSKQESKELLKEHVDECNEFWLNIFSEIKESEINLLYKSKKYFYIDLYRTFRTLTAYDRVINYLLKNMLEEYQKDILKTGSNVESREKICKEISSQIMGSEKISKEIISDLTKEIKKEKPRLVFFTYMWHDRGGLNRVISRVTSLLSPYYEVSILCMKEPGNENGYQIDRRVKFIEIDPYQFEHLPIFLKIFQTDIFISSNNCLVKLLKLYPIMEDLGIKVIMWNHEHFFVPYYEDSLNESVLVRGDIFNKVSVVLWLTEFSAQLGKIFSDRVGVMKNPVSFKTDEKWLNRRQSATIISIARFDSPRKHLDYLLAVFSRVLKNLPNAKLIIVGKYDLEMKTEITQGRSFSSFISRLKIPKENIVFTGEVKDINKYYKQASVNLMTSEREGFGLTILESASYGIPSIVFGGGGMEDVLIDEVEGYVVEVKNVEEMSQKIIDLLNDDDKYVKMSKASLKMIDRYSEEEVSKNWRKLIEGLLHLNREDLNIFIQENFFEKNKKIDEQYFKDVVNLYDEAFKKSIMLEKKFVDSQKSTLFRDRIRRKVPFGIRKIVKNTLVFIKNIILFIPKRIIRNDK